MILIAAADLGQTFSISELMVRAWERFPAEFGMREHPYPDTNRLRPRIYGKAGAIAKGWLSWVGKRLEISLSGRELLKDPPKVQVENSRADWAYRGQEVAFDDIANALPAQLAP